MQSQFPFLYLFLLIALVLAPIMTGHFFLNTSKIYPQLHKAALGLVALGFALGIKPLVFIWPLFCLFGFFLYLKRRFNVLFTLRGFAPCIPFTFSLIASLWLVSGMMDFHLLGYDKAWSFYAALHSSFLGWLFTGCLAFLAKRTEPNTKAYLLGCYLSFPCFLLVALGINGVPYIKRLGVVGFAVLVPLLIGLYFYQSRKGPKTSFVFSGLSFAGILLTMSLAVFYEFFPSSLPNFLGTSSMVSVHGMVNALVVLPCFYLAIYSDRRTPSGNS